MSDSKEDELVALAARVLERVYGLSGDGLTRPLIQAATKITPPQVTSSFRMITMDPGGVGGGQSVKPGNIRVNIRKAMVAIAGGVLTAVGVIAAPWTAILGILVVWDAVYSSLGVELSDATASVAWTMWKNVDAQETVAKTGLFEAINRERGSHNQVALTEQQYRIAIRALERMRCIESSANDETRWWLREWVQANYS